jgi:hypothetical protein
MRALLFAVLLIGCASEEPEPPQSLTDKQCVEGGKIYKLGATWDCSDGCNTCKCVDRGVEQTTMACDSSPPFVVDTAAPEDTRSPAVDTAVADVIDASGG